MHRPRTGFFLQCRFFMLFVTVNVLKCVALDLLAATSISTCTDDGSLSGPSNCSASLLIAAAIQNAEIDGTGALLYSVQSAAPFGGAEGLEPADEVSLVVTQSAIVLSYALTYLQDINAAPAETVYTSDAGGHPFGSLTNPCVASASSNSPACGWTLDAAGARLPFSQGFCCTCDVSADLTGYTIPRSGQRCTLFEERDSAHCLRMDDLWYAAYAIGAPAISFDMNLYVSACRVKANVRAVAGAAAVAALTAAAAAAGVPLAPAAADNAALAPDLRCSAPSATCECADANSNSQAPANAQPLGPAAPRRCIALPWSPPGARDICFELIGTFAPYEGTPELASLVLLVPSRCGAGASAACFARLVEGWDRWLLVPRAQTNLAGSACNSVGTSFEAFATQGSPCAQPRGTCLAGSPNTLYATDTARIAAGLPSRYFLSSVAAGGLPMPDGGAGAVAALQFHPPGAATPALLLPTQRFQKTVFTLKVRAAADSLRLVIGVATGVIDAASAPKFALASGAGTMTVSVRNTGARTSSFVVGVACDSAAILPIAARELALVPSKNATTTTVFPLIATAATLTVPSACIVTLLDSLGGVADMRRVNVTVTALVVDGGTQGGGGGGTIVGGGGGSGVDNSSGTATVAGLCGNVCSSWWDVSCAVSSASACASRLAGFAAGSMGLIAGLAAAFLALRYPAIFAGALRTICSCCGGGGGAVATPVRSARGGDARSSPRRRRDRARDRNRRPRRTVHDYSDDEGEEEEEEEVESDSSTSVVGRRRLGSPPRRAVQRPFSTSMKQKQHRHTLNPIIKAKWSAAAATAAYSESDPR